MSILIKGMEMPTSCYQCVAAFGGCCYVAPPETDGKCPMMGKPDWCPLIEIPPHGRLIDGDELEEDLRFAWMANFAEDFADVKVWDALRDATTIIEAENPQNTKKCGEKSEGEA